jgi:NADH:ubiquinone oxidoreductase subunit
MTVGTKLFTWLRGELVGSDKTGNRYYRDKKAAAGTRERRWVIYNGAPEASTVPAEWHGWLHHRTDDLPSADQPRRPWQAEHQPNLTGTAEAYRPPGSVLKGGQRDPATGDYEPWRPA